MPSPSKSFSHPVDFRYYRHQVRKRWWLVTLVVLVSLAVGAFKVVRLLPLYQSSARLMLREQQVNSKVNPFNDPLGAALGGSIGTHIKVLRSRSLAAQVIEQLSLESHPEFVDQADPLGDNIRKFKQLAVEQLVGMLTFLEEQLLDDTAIGAEKSMLSLWIDKLQHWARGVKNESKEQKEEKVYTTPLEEEEVWADPEIALWDDAPESEEAYSEVIDRFISLLQVRPESGSDIIRIGFVSHDARLTADVSNALIHLYIDFAREMRFSQVQEAMDWLNARAEEMQQKVEESELRLERYKEEQDVYAVEERIAGATEQLMGLDAKINELRTQRVEMEALHRQVQELAQDPKMLAMIPSLTGESPRLSTLNAGYDFSTIHFFLLNGDIELDRNWQLLV